MLTQIAIFIFGVSAILLVGYKDDEIRKWGFVLGLIGQPFWIYSSYQSEQWGILLMTLFYTFSWSRGIYTHWIKKVEHERRD